MGGTRWLRLVINEDLVLFCQEDSGDENKSLVSWVLNKGGKHISTSEKAYNALERGASNGLGANQQVFPSQRLVPPSCTFPRCRKGLFVDDLILRVCSFFSSLWQTEMQRALVGRKPDAQCLLTIWEPSDTRP